MSAHICFRLWFQCQPMPIICPLCSAVCSAVESLLSKGNYWWSGAWDSASEEFHLRRGDVQRCAKRCANGDVPRMCQVASTHNPPVFRMAPPPRQNHIPNSPMAFSLHVEQCRTATLSKQGNIIFYWTNNQISTATSQVLTAFSVCVCVHHRESSQKHVLSVYSLQLPNSQCKTQLLDKMKTCVKQMSVHVSSSHIYPHFKPLRPGIFMSSKFRPRLSCQRLAQFPLQTQKQVTASGSHKPKISKIKWS